MISVGSRDARKGLRFGGGREMDTELEEGEACSYQNNDDYAANIDPDIALSYLDEKLQDVLGHFQKDFEGGVSAENLGPKFGGYGSFLPSYQRSPVSSHTPTSPNNLPLEGGCSNSAVSVSHSVVRGPASTSSSSFPELKAPSVNDSGKQELSKHTTGAGEMTSRFYPTCKKAANLPDHKTLKVRIKVGSDNLSTKKNAAIYSGLGLEDSPSSSKDDSPLESEGISHESQDPSIESPTSILQTLTSFPEHGGLILSPLSDDLIHLVKEEKLQKEGTHLPLLRVGLESCGFLINMSDAVMNEGKLLGEKNNKSDERNDHSGKTKSGNNWDSRNGNGTASQKEKDLHALACEELVCKTLKLPILSNSYTSNVDMTNGKEAYKGFLKKSVISDHVDEEPNEPTFTEEDGWVEKQRIALVGKDLEDTKAGPSDSIHSNKEGQHKRQKAYDSVKADSHIKGRKALDTEVVGSSKHKDNKKDMPHEQENTRLATHEHSFLGEKEKSKGHHSTLVEESSNEISRFGSSFVPKIKKRAHKNNSASNSDSENFKSCKDARKNVDRYGEFFGELDEEIKMDMLEMPSNHKLKDTDGFTKITNVVNNTQKNRPIAKKIDKPSILEACSMVAAEAAPSPAKGTISVAAPVSGAAVVIKENWVQCEKCHKWRLLPLGTNPDNLPERWICSMLTWLPGMNRCSASEEETNQVNLHSNPGGFAAAPTLTNFRHPDQNPSSFGSHAVPGSGKKKHGIKATPSVTDKGSPGHLLNSKKKSTQAYGRNRSVKDVDISPLVNEPALQQLSKSNKLTSEKQKHKNKNKHKAKSHMNGGDAKHLKVKRKRVPQQDSSRASKKIKSEGKNIVVEDWDSDHSWPARRTRPSSSSGAPVSSVLKDCTKYSNHSSSVDPKIEVDDSPRVPIAKPKVKGEGLRDNRSLDMENNEDRGDTKKRKIMEFQNSTGHFQNGTVIVKEFRENDNREETKTRICRSDGKESSTNKGSGRTDNTSRHAKKQQHGQDLTCNLSQQSLDGMGSLKRDLGPMQTSLAATSSSSKVYGSHRTKSSFHEVKGSPVESVSSSPMRIQNPEKLITIGRDFKIKDGLQDVGHFALSSPRKSSDGEEFEGNGQAQAGRKCEMSALSRKQVGLSDNQHYVNGAVDGSGQDTKYLGKPLGSDQFCDEERKNECDYKANGSQPRKFGKGSPWLKDKNRIWKSDTCMGKINSSDDLNEQHGHLPSFEGKPEDSKNNSHKTFGCKLNGTDDKFVSKKVFTGKLSSESSKRQSHQNLGECNAQNLKADASCKNDVISTENQDPLQQCNDDKSSNRFPEKTDKVETGSGRQRPTPLAPSRGAQSETHCTQPVTVSQIGNGPGGLQVDVFERDAVKVQKHIKKADNQNGSHQLISRHPTKHGHGTKDHDAPSSLKRDYFSQAANNAMKEAADLKHLADRLKNYESTPLYFQAALKFLHGTSLMETSCSESAKHSEIMDTYSSTAKMCEFCAHEYERCKDMAAAALAYKCMEVAYMRVVYSSHSSTNRDRNEFQMALQMAHPGKSPISPASDVDNLNNLTAFDKATLPNGVSSPQVAPNHVIAAKSRPSFDRLLNFVQDINFAMEASRKSRIAYAAAKASMEDAKHESITSIKRALDFNFRDVDGLLHLVRVAMDKISS